MADSVPGRAGVAARELVLASAGSGKTYELSSRMIGLLAMEVPPQEILASTFTRKAAGEILDRVLLRLARGALDPGAASELATSMPDGVPRERLSREGCEALLHSLVRGLHRVQVGTLDAFFQQVGRTFAFELGLPQQWRIGTAPDRRRIEGAAVDAVLEEVDPEALVELVRMAGRGPAERDVHDLLMRGVEDLYEIHRMLDPAIADPWGFADADARFGPVATGELEGLRERLESVEIPRTKAGGENKTWASALTGDIAAVGGRDWESFLTGGLAKKLLGGEDTYARVEIPGEIRSIYEPLLEVARRELGRTYHRRIQALGRFLPEFDRRVRELRRSEGSYGFSDITAALARSRGLARTAELYYRLDGKIRHILLDEFQDTSNQQWAVLEPLLDEVLSGYEEERAVFIVADPKQSIYGWRGGDPRILEGIRKRYGLEPRTMARSWRSSPVVLDAVNRVFEDIEHNPVVADDAAHVLAWKRAFTHHEAVHEHLPGYVRLEAGPEEAPDHGRKKSWPHLFDHVASRVAQLHRSVPGASIGVLTRKNRSAVHIMSRLGELGVEVSEEGGVPIVDSAPVLLLLELLRMADHPGDSIARYLVSRTPVGTLVGMHGVDYMDDRFACERSRGLRELLASRGYGVVLSGWERKLRGSVSPRDRGRLRQLAELGFQWDERATSRPSEFVRMVETARAEDPAAARIRVMTVHRAKGLEFDAVFLPELDGAGFAGATRTTGYPLREGAMGPIRRVFPSIKTNLRPLFPEIEPAVDQAREAEIRDALSALYVGLTRARFAVYMHVTPDPDGKSSERSAARLVKEALTGTSESPPETLLWEQGDSGWWGDPDAPKRLEEPRRAGAAERTKAPSVKLARSPGRRMLPRRAPSGLHTGGPRALDRILGRPDTRARDRGTVIHRWLEAIEWLEAGVPDDSELGRLAFESAPRLREPGGLIETFRSWLQHPEIGALLSSEAFPEGTTVEREMEIVSRDGDHLLDGTIDRAIFFEDAGGPGVQIVDWKTDRIDPDDVGELETRTEFYRPQLEAYERGVAANERLSPERVKATLVFLEPGRIVEL